jgi:Tfp pilus assembly protein PilF
MKLKKRFTNSLSCCTIVKDEEKQINFFLNNIYDWVDELVLIDTGSKDRTLESVNHFANYMKAKKIRLDLFKWNDDFSAARNVSLDHAASDWILVLDADEIISDEDMMELRKTIDTVPKDVAGLRIKVKHYVNDPRIPGFKDCDDTCLHAEKYQGYIETDVIRVFRRDNRIRFDYRVYERVDNSVNSIGGKVKDTDFIIHHYGYKANERVDYYKKLLEKQLKETPQDAKPHYELALIYRSKGDFKKAFEMFKRCVELDPKHELVMLELGNCHREMKEFDKAVSCYNKHNEIKKEDFRGFVNLGLLYSKLGRVEKSNEMFKKAISLNNKISRPYNVMAENFIRQKDQDKAIDILEKSVKKFPYNFQAYNNLAGMYFSKNDVTKGLVVLESAFKLGCKNIVLLKNLEAVYRARDMDGKANKVEKVIKGIERT